jgi:hypothetical protein
LSSLDWEGRAPGGPSTSSTPASAFWRTLLPWACRVCALPVALLFSQSATAADRRPGFRQTAPSSIRGNPGFRQSPPTEVRADPEFRPAPAAVPAESGSRERVRTTAPTSTSASTWGQTTAEAPQFSPEPIREYGSGGYGTGTSGLRTIPRGGFQPDTVGVRQSTLFRNTRLPSGSPVTLPEPEPSVRTESVRGSIDLNLPSVHMGLPFLDRGFEPQDADLKLGPLFFKLRAVQAAVLHSDNIDLEPDDEKESGTIAMASLTLSVVAQFTESLRLATTGSIIYFPIEGEVGIAGLRWGSLYDLGLFAGPSTRAQLVWETKIGDWPVYIVDEFTVGVGTYSDDIRGDVALFDGAYFDAESRAGRYVFRPRNNGRNPDRDQDFDRRRNDFDEDTVVYSNRISVETERLLPGPVRLRAGVYREDLWYNQGNRGLPDLREGAFVSLASQRENLRFKPFANYEAFRSDSEDPFHHIFRAGIAGPITEHMYLFAEGGFWFREDEESGVLWRVGIDHAVGPYTHQSLVYARTFDDFHEEIWEGVGYTLRQILGPRLYASAFVYKLRIEDAFNDHTNDDEDFERNELRSGVRLTLAAGPKTTVRLTGLYSNFDIDNTEALIGRLEIGYRFTESVLGRFMYQYHRRTSDFELDNYKENLFFVSVTKFFE